MDDVGAVVGAARHGLRPPLDVGGPRHQHGLGARGRHLPAQAPAAPRDGTLGIHELGITPGRTTIGADLDARHRAVAPRGADDVDGGPARHLPVGRRPGDVRLHLHAHQRTTQRMSGRAIPVRVIGRFPITARLALDGLDRRQPLDRRHPVAARHDQPDRRAVRRWQRLAVESVGHERLARLRLDNRHATMERDRPGREWRVLHLALVHALEDEAGGIGRHAGLRQQVGDAHARPLRGADGAALPLHARHLRHQVLAAVAGALERHDLRDLRQRAELVERERERLPDRALDLQRPRGRVHRRHGEVAAHVVLVGRREELGERTEIALEILGGSLANDPLALHGGLREGVGGTRGQGRQGGGHRSDLQKRPAVLGHATRPSRTTPSLGHVSLRMHRPHWGNTGLQTCWPHVTRCRLMVAHQRRGATS